MNKMFLVISDSFSKWPEIFKVNKADTNNTLIKLKKVFARFGLPNTIVSDNGTPFTSSEFSEFCQYNRIQHLTSPPYHPSSNGADKNAVKTFKLGFKKILSDNENHYQIYNHYGSNSEVSPSSCWVCKKTGHLLRDCPDKVSRKTVCFGCGVEGDI